MSELLLPDWKQAKLETEKQKAREAVRKWQKANPDKVREAVRKWQKANPDKVREAVRKWQKEMIRKAKAYDKLMAEKQAGEKK